MRKFWQKRYISKYTGKEIDDAVAKAGTALQNPMTAAGDIIVGGEDGAAEKLTKGADGKVLKMVSGAPAWADDNEGMTNPMTTAGDLIVGGEDGAAGRLGKGTDGQVLSMVSGAPAWAAASGGAEHLYWHSVSISNQNSSAAIGFDYIAYITIINTNSNAMTKDDVKNEINNNTTAKYICGAGVTTMQGVYPIYIMWYSDTQFGLYRSYPSGTSLERALQTWSDTDVNVYDYVNQIF